MARAVLIGTLPPRFPRGIAAGARLAAIEAHPAVREAAGVNTALAEEHARLVDAAKAARQPGDGEAAAELPVVDDRSLELRVFTTGVINARLLRHELHLAIDDAVRAHGVEIAFPQQDLHVRSLPNGWPERPGQPAEVEPPASSEPAARPGARRVA